MGDFLISLWQENEGKRMSLGMLLPSFSCQCESAQIYRKGAERQSRQISEAWLNSAPTPPLCPSAANRSPLDDPTQI